jgi:hypothetical protein
MDRGEPITDLSKACPTCGAKTGERCGSDAWVVGSTTVRTLYRSYTHAARRRTTA